MAFIRVAFLLSCIALLGSFSSAQKDEAIEHMCENFVSSIMNSFKESEEQKIIDFLNTNVCEEIFIGQETCKLAVNAVVPGIFKKLEDEVSPKMVCTAIFKSKMSEQRKEMLSDVVLLLSSNSLECEECRVVSKAILDTLLDDEVQYNIIQSAIKHICPFFGNDADSLSKCDTMISMAQQAIAPLLERLSIDKVCARLGSCQLMTNDVHVMEEVEEDEEVEDDESEVSAQNFDMKCTSCKSIVRTIEKHIDGKRTESHIIHVLDNVCDHLHFFKSKCRRLVDYKLKRLVDAFTDELKPEEICQIAGACA